jgi:hypothetical protein
MTNNILLFTLQPSCELYMNNIKHIDNVFAPSSKVQQMIKSGCIHYTTARSKLIIFLFHHGCVVQPFYQLCFYSD